MTLILKPISGFPGYFAGDDGFIRRNDLTMRGLWCEENPHKHVALHRNGDIHQKYVHRLIAKAFVNNPRPDIFRKVDHIDQNEHNNHPSNLRWLTTQLNGLNNSADGCSFNKIKKRWHARVRVDGYLNHLGDYKTFLEAHLVAKAFREKAFDRIYKGHLDEGPQGRTYMFV